MPIWNRNTHMGAHAQRLDNFPQGKWIRTRSSYLQNQSLIASQLQMVVGNAYNATLGVSKASILMFYVRVFTKRSFQILVYLTLGFVVCYVVPGPFVIVFSCLPVAASWDLTLAALPTTKCIDRPAAYLATAAFNIFSDIVIIILPCREIWKLQMPRRQKLSLMAIFCVGFL